MPDFYDAVPLEGARITKDGYLVADVRVARTGIQEYLGREVGRPEMERVRLYRPAEEVFSVDALASFAHRPVTNNHPNKAVTAETWRAVSRGHTGGEVVADGAFIRVPLMLADKASIDAVQAGKRELSAGYTCDIDWTAGTTAEGESYDGVQRTIRGNHVAIVTKGRAGSECRIGDEQNEEPPMKTIVVDGISVEVSDASAVSLEAVSTRLADARKLADNRDGELAALRISHAADVAALTARIPDAVTMDAAITARMAVIDAARKVLGSNFDAAGKTDADVRKAVVTARLGDAKVTGKSDDYIASAFDVLTHDAKPVDALAQAIANQAPVLKDAAPVTSAYDDYLADLRSSHLNNHSKEA